MYNYFQILWKFNWINDNIDGIKIKIDSNLHERPDFFYLINHEQIFNINNRKHYDYSKVIDVLNDISYKLESSHDGKITWNLLKKIKSECILKLNELGFYNNYEITQKV